MGDDLQQVVLDDVANRADLLVELAPRLHAERLGHRDLDAVDEVAVPDRLEERVREPKEQQVLHGLLAEVVVDPEHVGLGERSVQGLVELARRLQIAPERFLDDHARAVRTARLAKIIGDGREQARRQRQIMQRVRGTVERLAQRGERRRFAVIAVDVAQ